jgi:ABC-2 type transport system ATP-binding protein
MSVIETNGLTKFYGKSRGIENVSLNVEEGEVFGFIGPNGAGKSTTIRTLLGLIKPTGGTATIFDRDVAKEGALIRQEIGYLPSEVFYYDNMKVRDLLKYSASFYKKPRHDMEARKNVLAKQLDLDLNKKIQDLSYGNRKKVGIIQGLIHDPKLIILDEPTGGLDPLMQQTFFDILREESARGKTILFSSHILSEVQKLCHRVAIIKEGQIVATEEIDALRRNSYVKVGMELGAPVTKSRLKLAGVSNVQVSGNKVSFLYQGDVNAVVKMLSGIKLKNLSIEEPELEEIFMHYYVKD